MAKRRPQQQRAVRRGKPRFSRPGEHGGAVLIAGTSVLATLLAANSGVAALAGVVLVAAYFARGPVERWARSLRGRSWDGRVTLFYAAIVVVGVVVIARDRPLAGVLTGVAAAGIVGGGAIVTRGRLHRTLVVEVLALAVCGGAAGVVLFAGGSSIRTALVAGFVLAAYGAATAPLVRTELRRGPAAGTGTTERALAAGLLFVGSAAAYLAAPFAPWVGLALVPRLVHVCWRQFIEPGAYSVNVIAARETAELALVSVLVAALL